MFRRTSALVRTLAALKTFSGWSLPLTVTGSSVSNSTINAHASRVSWSTHTVFGAALHMSRALMLTIDPIAHISRRDWLPTNPE